MKFKTGLYQPFYRAGMWITKKILNPNHAGYKKMERELAFIFDWEEDRSMEKHTAEKIARILFILFWGTGICILAELAAGGNSRVVAVMERPSCGQGEAETELVVQIEGETEKEEIPMKIRERHYTDAEIAEMFHKIKKEMEKTVLGENESLQEVRQPLYFPVSFENGSITAEWFTDPFEMLSETGEIEGKPDENGTQVEVMVNLKCQEQTDEYSFYVNVFPPVKSEKEALIQKIKDAVEAADEMLISEKEMVLPQEVDGKKLYWEKKKEPVTGILAVIVLVAAICLTQSEDEKVHKLAREKRMGLMMDYPAFLYKLTALLRAGLTMRAAFSKIAENYRQAEKEQIEKEQGKKKNGKKGDGKKGYKKNKERKRYVYEEVIRCCNEIEGGVAEAQAYENFGKRCQLPEYVKTGSILAQNLKKGSDGLADILEKEAIQGMEERRNLARKLGEQAGTKLLFPMMLMLVVVMVILMVPAILSFSY